MTQKFIHPTGDDGNSGADTDNPFKSFDKLVGELGPGDEGIAMDGTYTIAQNGNLAINSSTAVNGSPGSPITVRAQNERKAFIETLGLISGVHISGREWWDIIGLRVKGLDDENNSHDTVRVHQSANCNLKRMLITHNNRYFNRHLLGITQSEEILVEEIEFYYFHRHAGRANNCVFITVRRCYGNSRGHGNIEGGRHSLNPEGGDDLFAFYPASDCIQENCIMEGSSNKISDISPTFFPPGARRNKVLGNVIFLGGSSGGVYSAANRPGDTDGVMPLDNVWEHNVTIGANSRGVLFRGGRGNTVRNMSVFNAGDRGVEHNLQSSRPGDGGPYTSHWTNILIVGSTNAGIRITNDIDAVVEYVNSFGNSPNFDLGSGVESSNLTQIDPEISPILPWIPLDSPMKGAGKDGEDIGANVLLRYKDGVLTDEPLWDQTTGEFPHGALVEGVNDIVGDSAFDVHDRLNVTPQALSDVLGTPPPEPQDPEPEPDVDYITTIDTVPESIHSVGRGYQQQIGWVAEDRVWAWYSDETNFVVRSKQIQEGGSWSEKQTVVAGVVNTTDADVCRTPTGEFWVVWVDDGDLKYRRVLLDGADITLGDVGTLWTDETWGVDDPGGRHCVRADDLGHIWVGAQITDGTNRKPIGISVIPDGATLTARTGWPKDLDSQNTDASHGRSILPLHLDDGEILWSWVDVANDRLSARLWERGDPTAEGALGGIENAGMSPAGSSFRNNAVATTEDTDRVAIIQCYGGQIAKRSADGTWSKVFDGFDPPTNNGGITLRGTTLRNWRNASGSMRYRRSDDHGETWGTEVSKFTFAAGLVRQNASHLPFSDLDGYVVVWQSDAGGEGMGELRLLLEGDVDLPAAPPPENKKWWGGSRIR